MNCIKCGLGKIGLSVAYQCSEKHMQCKECNEETLGKCGLCSNNTFLMEFAGNAQPVSVEAQTVPKEMSDLSVVAQIMLSGNCKRNSKGRSPQHSNPLTATGSSVDDEAADDMEVSTGSEKKKAKKDSTREKTTNFFDIVLPNIKKERIPLIVKTLYSSLYRALYDPTYDKQNNDMPSPQCKRIYRNWPNAEEIVTQVEMLHDFYKPSNFLTLNRSPITCSVGICGQTILFAEYNKHLIIDHLNVKWDTIAKSECKSFRVDPRTVRKGMNTCQILYLLNNDVGKLNASEMHYMLPLLVMSTRICTLDVSEMSTTQVGTKNNEYIMFWVAGFRPEEFLITANLVLWSRNTVPARRVKTGEIFCLRSEGFHKDIFHNFKTMVLSAADIDIFTNNGENMLEMQLVVE